MTTLREAAQQALEALDHWETHEYYEQEMSIRREAITALRTALMSVPDGEEPQDPVAYNGWVLREVLFDNGEPVAYREPPKAEQPAEQSANPVGAVFQEPVAWWIPKAEQFCVKKPGERPFAKAWQPLYTAPQPAKPAERKPLTREEIDAVMRKALGYGLSPSRDDLDFARAIEAAHGIAGETK